MRKALLAVVVTAMGLVLLLSFKPHDVTALARPPAAVGAQEGQAGAAGTDGRVDRARPPAPLAEGDDHDADDEHHEDDEHEHDENRETPLGVNPPVASSPSVSAPAATAPSATGRTFVGDVADTRWGPVQVEITVSGGKIGDVRVLRSPDANHRDIQINNAALPVLVQETLAAQSAQIDAVSGATYTSDGYIRSLQSAIDRAGL
jgi:uncharacterized protein with FMN-binding domain